MDAKEKSAKCKLPIIIAIAALVVIAAIVAGILIRLNGPLRKFQSYMDNQEYSQAGAIVDANQGDSELLAAASERFAQEAQLVYNAYLDETITYDDAIANLKQFSAYTDVNALTDTISDIKKSRNYFEQGENYFNKGSYMLAINKYSSVISKDPNYNTAQTRIAECKDAFCIEVIELANHLYDIGEYNRAYNTLAQVSSQYATEALKTRMKEISNTIRDNALSEALQLSETDNYRAAIAVLASVEDIVPSIITEKQEYLKAYTLNVIKPKLTVKYDDIDKRYSMYNGGTTIINHTTNLFACVAYNNNTLVSFYLSAGFIQNYWLFMDSITFDCDGEQIEWNFKHYDCMTGVIWGGGGIYEMYTVAHTDDIELISLLAEFQDLSELMNLFETAQTVRIRFRGDGLFDVTIPHNRIEQIIELWYLYQTLDSGVVSINDLID